MQEPTQTLEGKPSSVLITFVGGPLDGRKEPATISGKPLNENHMLILPVRDKLKRRIADHIYKHKGGGVFEYQGQTGIRNVNKWQHIQKSAVRKVKSLVNAVLRSR